MKFMEAMELAQQGIRVTCPNLSRMQYVCIDPNDPAAEPMPRLHRWHWPTLDHSRYISGHGRLSDPLDGMAEWSVWIEPKKDTWGQPIEPGTGEKL